MLPSSWASLALLLALASPAAAEGDGCSHDSFVVDHQPVSLRICGPSEDGLAHTGAVTLTESVDSHGTSFSRTVSLEPLAGSDDSRTIDDLPLARIGILRSLHLTIRFK